MNATIEPAGAALSSSALGNVSFEMQPADAGDGAQFRAALERRMQGGPEKVKTDNASLGSAIVGRTTHLASEIKQDQQYVSKLLEQATRTGDSMHLMKAMMALNDFQLRVQTISKVVSKAVSSVDSLTKLQ